MAKEQENTRLISTSWDLLKLISIQKGNHSFCGVGCGFLNKEVLMASHTITLCSGI